MTNARGSAAVVVLIILAGILLAFGNIMVFAAAIGVDIMASPMEQMIQIYERQQVQFLYFVITPILFALIAALLSSARGTTEETVVIQTESDSGEPLPPSPAPALRLLARLQQEGRLIDFLEEDVAPYSDAQVGAAARTVHAGCRKVLKECVRIERVLSAEDGSEVDVEAGFDPAQIRLTGNVHGEPPFHGVLQHGGYRVAELTIPEVPAEPTILAPAEVEIA